MNKTKVNANAKINFTLDITGKEGGYHNLSSLVTTISLCDTIKVKKRKDDKIVLKVKGETGCNEKDNNAYKAAKLFKDTYKTSGFNVTLKKRIPVGGGVGGSSADIAGTLNALKTLFNIDGDIIELANKLGSDSGYMTLGGYAVLEGRGDKFKVIDCSDKFYLILCLSDGMVSSKEAYRIYDTQSKKSAPSTKKAVSSLIKGDKAKFYTLLKNDLYLPAIEILPEIKDNLEALKEYAPAFMTGSGSITCAVFTGKKSRDLAFKKLKKKLPNKLIKVETV